MNFEPNIFIKFFSWIKGKIFWRNANIIYINSNKKKFNKDYIDCKRATRKSRWLTCESNTKLGYKFYKKHLLKMKLRLFDIIRNCDENCDITYSGFVSTMFSAYDGYCLGDNRNYTFVDIDSGTSNPYLIEYKKKYKKDINVDINDSVINILVSSTFDIDDGFISKGQTFAFNQKSGNKVSSKYLIEAFNYVKTILDEATNKKVELVNLYICAKQPIGFIIGTAIQSYHPLVKVYEFSKGKYTGCIRIQDGNLEGEEW